tara:strand:- start:683 stop:826 length:144 start_codon:yes stop_codon:yes gene_type:complete
MDEEQEELTFDFEDFDLAELESLTSDDSWSAGSFGISDCGIDPTWLD